MRITNIRSRLALNSALAQFMDRRKHGYQIEGKDIRIIPIDTCDVCGAECEAPNGFTIVNAPSFTIDALKMRKIQERNDITDELGACDALGGICTCPKCYKEETNEAPQVTTTASHHIG